jgi:hypothetical protein
MPWRAMTMSKPSPDVPPLSDLDVPATLPLSVILRYRHRRHQKAMALGYAIAAAMILTAFAARNGIVFWFGAGFAFATRDLGQRVCRKQRCRAFRK